MHSNQNDIGLRTNDLQKEPAQMERDQYWLPKCRTKKPSVLKVTSERPCECSTCGMSFACCEALNKHTRTHAGGPSFPCQICGKTFLKRYNLKLHFRSHTGDRPYTCDTCGKTFSQKSHLTLHVRIHTGYRPYICDTCGKTFTQKNDLTKHTRVHTGDRPYTCDTCGKTFPRKGSLTRHLKSQTGDHSHTSSKSFTRGNNLPSDVGTHAGHHLYTYVTHAKVYTQSASLSMTTHCDSEHYACITCQILFVHIGQLTAHLNTHSNHRSC